MPPSIICGCRRWPSAQAQSENLGTEPLSRAEPEVRIHLPPAENPLRTQFGQRRLADEIAAGPSGRSSPVILPAIATALAYVAVIVFAARPMTA
jgi:hypothetical protein